MTVTVAKLFIKTCHIIDFLTMIEIIDYTRFSDQPAVLDPLPAFQDNVVALKGPVQPRKE
jgi:hypothetical protein